MMESLRINRSKTIFQYYAIQTLKTDKKLKLKKFKTKCASAKRHQMELMFHMVTLYVKMHPLKKYLLDIKKKVGPAAP